MSLPRMEKKFGQFLLGQLRVIMVEQIVNESGRFL